MAVDPIRTTARIPGNTAPSPPLLAEPVSTATTEPSAEDPPPEPAGPLDEPEDGEAWPETLLCPPPTSPGAVLIATAAAALPSAPWALSDRWVDREIELPELPPVGEAPPVPPPPATPPPAELPLRWLAPLPWDTSELVERLPLSVGMLSMY